MALSAQCCSLLIHRQPTLTCPQHGKGRPCSICYAAVAGFAGDIAVAEGQSRGWALGRGSLYACWVAGKGMSALVDEYTMAKAAGLINGIAEEKGVAALRL